MSHAVRFPRIRRLTISLALAGLSGLALAASDAQFSPAFSQFQQASRGDQAAIEAAAESFSALLQTEPTNPVLMAYAGAATSMKATTTMLPWKKMGFAEDGLAQLDKALALLNTSHDAPMQHGTPGTLEVKFVAANTFLAVPGFMNRHDRGSKLLGEVLSSPLFASAPLGFKGSVWMTAASQARKANNATEARRLLDMVVQEKAPQAAQAQRLIEGPAS